MGQGNGQSRVKLSGFNNLTKVLSFNFYDFCITLDEDQRKEYVKYINEKYSARKILHISKEICKIISANILNATVQEYDPVGASTMVLMSDMEGGGWNELGSGNGVDTSQVALHLDKSHITAHTYPDATDPNGICSFRVDIDIATCGDIIPLKAINYLFEAFECDVVYIDYVVRGYTRLENGKKIYNDYQFNSIRDFIKPEIIEQFDVGADINLPRDNIWQTKLLIKDFTAKRYLFNPEESEDSRVPQKINQLKEEMKEVFHLIH